MREHKIKKTYAAIVKGQVSLDQQLIDAPLLRYELANGERRVRVTKEGKPSKTEWKVIERFKAATFSFSTSKGTTVPASLTRSGLLMDRWC